MRPRTTPDEAGLGPALDALGGEVVRIRARDGLRLSGRWLAAEGDDPTWTPDPHEAILLLHGWSGSIVPHLVEYGPYLRRTAGVLGLDFRGHGESDDSPTTFGLREVEDVAGALAWLGERGIERVALVGMSMGGITAIAAVAVLGEGSLLTHRRGSRRPRLTSSRRGGRGSWRSSPTRSRRSSQRSPSRSSPGRRPRLLANRLFDTVARTLGADPRDTEPIRVIGLLEGVDTLLISGDRDPIVPVDDARRLAAAAPPGTALWVVEGAGHRGAHARRSGGLRVADHEPSADRVSRQPPARPIIGQPAPSAGGTARIPGGLMPAKILVVDDDPNVQRLLQYTLKQEGYDVVIAADGAEGFRLWGTEAPDLILLDVVLPSLDGYQVATKIRAEEAANVHVPIIMLTAEREVEQKVRGLRAGADDYLIKPFHPAELLARIKSLLARFAPRETLLARPPLGRVLAFYPAKGGVGSTTIAINAAIALHRELGRKVCLVDGNLQFGDHRVFLDLGLDRKSIVDVVSAPTIDPDLLKSGAREARLRDRPAARAAVARDGRAGPTRITCRTSPGCCGRCTTTS